ncbi:MAG: DUF1592 domain-containing protein [Planctomycetota bacterium]|nr:MAG: DUF1592 domain-containing protein [Planctomycetota bacterium]
MREMAWLRALPRPALLAAGAALASLAALAGPGSDPEFERVVRPFVLQHCAACHGEEKPKAKMSLTRFADAAAAQAAPEVWLEVRARLAAGEMPPEGRPRPAPADAQAVIEWIERNISLEDVASDPGRPLLRRLNRAEYRNTVRDLLGVDYPADAEFPADTVGRGFDNQGDALALTDLQLEKYVQAAERIAELAVVVPEEGPPRQRRYDFDELEGPRGQDSVALYAQGEAAARYGVPRAGDYLLRVRAWGDQAGPEPCKLALLVDGIAVHAAAVEARADAPQVVEARLALEAGERRVSARFLNDYYHPEDPDPAQRDRNLYIGWIEVLGPLDPPAITPFQSRLLARFGPELGSRRLRAILEHLATRAWRRPASPADVARLERLTPAGSGLEVRVQTALVALLSAPRFLYRVEEDPPGSSASRALNGYELATRLSYLVWSSTPDEELFACAADGTLTRPEVLDAQLERLLHSPRARALADGFAAQWLQLRSLDKLRPDPALFPEYDDALRADMRDETLALFQAVLREDRSVWDLLRADFSYLNERLARLYGIPGVSGAALRRVSLQGTPRRGLLTQAAILTVTSNPARTSPVKRGKWILDNVLGAPPPPPPPGVPLIDESPAAAAASSLRERMERHRSDPNCAVCHTRMDVLGFGLEHFDPIGRYRERDGAFAVDASGSLPDGARFDGAQELVGVLQRGDAFPRCLTEKLLVYALGRSLEPADRRAVDRILAELDPQEPTLSGILRGIVHSEAFTRRRVGS